MKLKNIFTKALMFLGVILLYVSIASFVVNGENREASAQSSDDPEAAEIVNGIEEEGVSTTDAELPVFNWEEHMIPIGQNRPSPGQGVFISVESLVALEAYRVELDELLAELTGRVTHLEALQTQCISDRFLLNQQLENLALGGPEPEVKSGLLSSISMYAVLLFAIIGLIVGFFLRDHGSGSSERD